MSKSTQPSLKRFRDASNRSNVSSGHLGRDHPRQSVGPKAQFLTESSVSSAKSNKPECGQCGRRHMGECLGKYSNRVCYKCGSQDHFIRDCPKLAEEENVQNVRPSGSQRGTTDTVVSVFESVSVEENTLIWPKRQAESELHRAV
ncbi:terminal uridylyltransferase 7-like [Gossypium australe]|uniref:Terminal uridylyltransferase 7-like n=1 Tax=Gossypium australe TaxID=47621 RepID=A0A5B6WGX2_9ROSI|nr:terminal uridylyltransferase 7-like [Gossypium australe]